MLSPPVFAQGPQPSSWSYPCSTITPEAGEVALIQGLGCIYRNVVTVVMALAGLAVFVMLLAGGLKYLTSGGDQKAMEQAKGTITYAIFGLVLIVAAYLILNFLSIFTGIGQLLHFTIPGP